MPILSMKWSSVTKSGLRLVINVYCKLLGNTKKNSKKKYYWYAKRGEKMQSNQIIKTRKGRNKREPKKQKTKMKYK